MAARQAHRRNYGSTAMAPGPFLSSKPVPVGPVTPAQAWAGAVAVAAALAAGGIPLDTSQVTRSGTMSVARLEVVLNIAVIGGAGYIGSHAVKLLVDKGHAVTCIDNLSNGHRAAVERAGGGKARLHVADLAETFQIIDIFQRERVAAVMHFAASAYVGESVTDPRKYYRNNVSNTMSMLDAMHAAGVKKLVCRSRKTCRSSPSTRMARRS